MFKGIKKLSVASIIMSALANNVEAGADKYIWGTNVQMSSLDGFSATPIDPLNLNLTSFDDGDVLIFHGVVFPGPGGFSVHRAVVSNLTDPLPSVVQYTYPGLFRVELNPGESLTLNTKFEALTGATFNSGASVAFSGGIITVNSNFATTPHIMSGINVADSDVTFNTKIDIRSLITNQDGHATFNEEVSILNQMRIQPDSIAIFNKDVPCDNLFIEGNLVELPGGGPPFKTGNSPARLILGKGASFTTTEILLLGLGVEFEFKGDAKITVTDITPFAFFGGGYQ